MSSSYHVGKRVSLKGRLCTVRYIGPVEGTKSGKEYLGVEWDDLKGKHDGTHQGKRYFTCWSQSPTAASFVLSSSWTADPEQSFVSAVKGKYGTPAVADDSDEIVISGKTVEEVGFDKIRAQQARLHELKIVLVDGQRISHAENSPGEIRHVCPKIEELDLSRNIIENFAEVAEICKELESLKSLRLNGNRFSDLVGQHSLAKEHPYVNGFTKVTDLTMDGMLLDWSGFVCAVAQFQGLRSFEASMNGLKNLAISPPAEKLTSLTLEYNSFESLSDIIILRELKFLEVLRLKGNEISKISTEANKLAEVPAFGNQLRYVDLSYNAVSDWKFVDEMDHVFPGMTALRLAHNPIYKTSKKVGSFTSMDDSYMLTLARIRKLETLNFSKITTADRTNSEMFYLSQIAKEISEAPEGRENDTIKRHPRYADLCEKHGTPSITRNQVGVVNPNFLEARLIKFTLYMPPNTQANQQQEIRMRREIPMSFDVYALKGLVGRMFGVRPLSMRLIWETGEWDPVAGYEDFEDEEDDAEDGAVDQRTKEAGDQGKWMRREVEIEDGTRQLGNLVDGLEATDLKKVKFIFLEKTDTFRSVDMHTNNLHVGQRCKPWPAYFLVRTTGEVVPLIAVDELPTGTNLVGVPRSLDLEDTIGMLNLGLQRSSDTCYQLASAHEAKSQVAVANTGKVVDKQTTELPSLPSTPDRNHTHPPTTTPNSTPPATPKAPLVHPAHPCTRASSFSLPAPATPVSAPTPTPQTQLCRHWCHHGICKWGQQCRYRHIMPMSSSGLQEVGLGDWPLWFRRLNPGYFASESLHPNSDLARAGDKDRRSRRPSVRLCTSTGSNGVTCCGVLHGPGRGRERARPREIHGLRGKGVQDRAERSGLRMVRNEELGEQIVSRLRSMAREQPEKVAEKERGERGLSSSVLIEKATVRDTKNWEDESDGSRESGQGQEEKEEDRKLVDV
ncbi:CAP-Gly domain-containing protein [Diplocarpon rosae]|nr:CAP-Gly domain-containing protein [Diplocarpon rosae]